MSRTARVLLAIFTDAVCLAVFVLAGRESHGIETGVTWYLTVLWPFLAGWFALAIITGLYVAGARLWLRLALTIVAGIALALLLRATVTHRDTPVAFCIVAYAFITLLTVGWRLLLLGMLRVSAGRGRARAR